MTLRLKKIDLWNWTAPTHKINRSNQICYCDGVAFYTWTPKNTYQTEYRKMRAALVAYLEPKETEVSPELLDRLKNHYLPMEEKVRRLEIEIEKQRRDYDVAQAHINFLKEQLNELGWKASSETEFQASLLHQYKQIQKKMGHKRWPRPIDFDQAPDIGLPRTVTH